MSFSIDFHSHSFWSDGDVSPQKLIERAKQRSIYFLVLTDHATIGGAKIFMNSCKKLGIKTIVGVELTCVYEKIWFDVLVFGFKITNGQIIDSMEKNWLVLSNISQKYIKWLQKNVVSISWEEILEYYKMPLKATPSLYFINRYRREVFFHNQLDIGQDIKKAGVRQIDRREFYLNRGPKIEEVLKVAENSGALVSLAHPIKTSNFLSRLKKIDSKSCLDELLAIVKKIKIKGIEVRHHFHKDIDVCKLIKFSKKNNLIITGGSDYHGDKHKKNVHLGDHGLEEEEFEKIKKYLNL